MSERVFGLKGPRRGWIGLVALALCAGLVAAVGGCTNAVYFYQTDKFSFTAEGRPDASAPLQANLGIKQRVVLVVPPGDPTADDVACTCPAGTDPCVCGKSAAALGKKESSQDAVSVISYFDFWKQPPKPSRSFLDSRFTIHSSFLTGAAADEIGKLQDGSAARAAVAIAGADPAVRRSAYAAINHMIDAVDELGGKGNADAAARLAALTAFATTVTPPFERFSQYKLDLNTGMSSSEYPRIDDPPQTTFTTIRDLTEYMGRLNDSLVALDQVRSQVAAGRAVQGLTLRPAELEAIIALQREALNGLESSLFASPQYQAVVSFFVEEISQ